ncbi:Crp/Fnr family transcriptional regulator [Novosphingobium beihaiensis]|uniref:Crp/Fnr family transcriptional regulator n=1 Tax=Novosphingobium beihaiensis TaxID=2930389 RepID=A0ABT0BVB4_9SPHN|nr:Crp/Fnr family transcriptional regulator [Novosphingobium beihaiensis]MCJ2188873.1 Crp/Fnr family transcriptional regulator [Novosphingobium beihaiensis]
MFDHSSLFSSLGEADQALLRKHMTSMELTNGHVLYEPGDHVDHAYFPLGPSLASFLVVMEDGRSIETAMIGNEGAIGGIVSHGLLPAFSRACVMHSGPFLRIASRNLEAAKNESAAIRNLFTRYADCLMAQVFQSVACNAVHPLGQRAAKWLSAAVERTGTQEITITQDQLASFLGVGRSYVSRMLQRLRAQKLIETRRGGIAVRSPETLKRMACNCNGLVRDHFATVLTDI